ncbi:YybH family protein [Sphingobium sp.]|uniref:YybH family protein n=1 Tax=Sphingobium sp. TaxID=1912891 RepID=UPI003BB5FF67
MKARLALLVMGAAALVAAKPPLRFQPDPSSVIAAEIAFNRLAQDKGQWTAFRATAADDAVMFMPGRVLAKDWLKGRADPSAPVSWSPSIAYVSCGGDLAASTGNWKRTDGSAGYFTTIWRRDKKGAWKWILDHGDTLASPRAAPEFLTGKVATCKRGAGQDRPPTMPMGKPDKNAPPPPPDESLLWGVDSATDGGRTVTVSLWNGTGYDVVIRDVVAAGKGKTGS